MISVKRVNDLEYIKEKIKKLLIARPNASATDQIAINLELTMLYDFKRNILSKGVENE